MNYAAKASNKEMGFRPNLFEQLFDDQPRHLAHELVVRHVEACALVGVPDEGADHADA